jgi:hypothetical protein
MAERDYYQMKAQEVLDALGTSEKGLPRNEAEKRREKYGPNEIRTDVSVPKWLLFLSQFKEVLVLVLIVAGIISFVIGILDNSPESIRNGAVMFAIVLINAIIGFVQQYKAGKILERLRELIKSPARVMVAGELSEISQDQLVPGDIVRLEEGDKVPADMRIIESFNLRTNDFSLTGESMPHGRQTNAIKERCVLADRDNMAYLGTTVASGNATGVVVRTGMHTEMGKIANMTEETRKTKSPARGFGELAHGNRCRDQRHPVPGGALAGLQLCCEHDLCPRDRRRSGAPGAARPGHGGTIHHEQAPGRAECGGQKPPFRGDAGIDNRYLYGQDGHANQERDDGNNRLVQRERVRGHGDRVRARRRNA